MNIAFFVNTKNGTQILAKTHSVEKAVTLARQIKADGVILDIDTALRLLLKSEDYPKEARSYISAKTHSGIQRVPLANILYFQADQKYVTVYHTQGTLLIEDTLKELELEFPEFFMRVHRNILANVHEFHALEKDEKGNVYLKLKNYKKPLPVSRRKLPSVRRRIK